MSEKKEEKVEKATPIGKAVENLMKVCKKSSEDSENDNENHAVFCVAIDSQGINMSMAGHGYVISAMIATALLEDERISQAIEAAQLMSQKMKEEVSEYKPTTEA
jgi:hypothetical protein